MTDRIKLAEELEAAEGLTETERAYLTRTPLQEPAQAAIISYWTGEVDGGCAYAGFARRHPELIARVRNVPGTLWLYRLTETGAAVSAALKAGE